MIINKIKLENIRSYLNQEIEFPLGSTLLAGDIGSGKSTILLAIDFALFGLRKSSLSGGSLLRNGKNKGSVELHFNIDDKDVVIKRTLKRGTNIVQDEGYIVINGIKKEGTAIELKQKILDLLGYPKELLTKSKSLIFRYTVYTPQEEMKHILLGEKDFKLDTLRKVFGVDKYKKIIENSEIIVKNLKDRKKEIQIKIEDLNDKKEEYKNKNNEFKKLQENLNKIIVEFKNHNKKVLDSKENLKKEEENLDRFRKLKQELEINEVNLLNKLDKRKSIKEDLGEISNLIKQLDYELKQNYKIELKETSDEVQKPIRVLENSVEKIRDKIQEFNVKKDNSEDIIKNISKLDICPVCNQKVTKEHIKQVNNEENEKIKKYEEELKINMSLEKEARDSLLELKNKLEIIRKNEGILELIKLKQDSLDEKIKEKNKFEKQDKLLKKEIGKINLRKQELNKQIDKFDLDKYDKLKEELDYLLDKQKNTEINKSNLEIRIEDIKEDIESLNKEIIEKEKYVLDLSKINTIQDWLDNSFVNLMNTMEKKIMLKVHNDFNSLFQRWFEMLIESELLKIKLDEEFSPLIDQNGHEMDYNYLSGGEKTAIALAYRLALNQVINGLISTIKTKNLIILDEPTDGFSSEQLDKLKFVLEELENIQVILVSHEQKIESFVDNVIKIEKSGHVSSVV